MPDLSNTPAIDDFSIELRDRRIEFVDGDGQRIAWFPAWECADRDLRHFIAADVPLGSMDSPYEDFDDDWRITIYEHEGFVYVTENETSFRVTRDAYLEAWARVLHEFNPVLSLEELLARAGRDSET